MKRFALLALFIVGIGGLADAKVVGPRVESLGTQWKTIELADWLSGRDSVLTPQTTHLALQWCFRDSQKAIDIPAYAIAKQAVEELAKVYRPDIDPFESPHEKAFVELAALLKAIDAIDTGEQFPSPRGYEDACNQVVEKRLRDSQATLAPLFQGRMNPRVPEALARKNLRLTPLSWDGLREQICKLEGYYSTSYRPEHWKFFSLTRAMGNVLPAEKDNAAFVKAAKLAPAMLPLLRKLDRYSAVAGKFNGVALSLSDEEAARAPLRLTGPALGSRATALLAFFTTAWRERLQELTMTRPYPAEPFRLISLDETLGALAASGESAAAASATERAMLAWKAALAENNDDFDRTSALAWLALNAETNIRQNEKLPGVEVTSVPVRPALTTLVLGSPRYAAMAAEIGAALGAYREVDADGRFTPPCVTGIQTFLSAASAVPTGKVKRLAAGSTEVFRALKVEPVIADIGQEVNDDEDGKFRLHLATGFGRAVPLNFDGKAYVGWTPSAFVLHLPVILSTSEWQSAKVREYDRDNP